MHRRILVIGYGNPLRGDDGLGWHAAHKLAEILTNPSIEVIASHQLTPEMSEKISQADFVIFIDSLLGPGEGKIIIRPLQPRRQEENSTAFSHHATPELLLAEAEILFGRCPKAFVVSMECHKFKFNEKLSPSIEKKMPELIQAVIGLIGD